MQHRPRSTYTKRPLRVLLLLNAPQNDWLGLDLMNAIKKQQNEAVFFGIGGPLMEKAGLHGLPGMAHRMNFLALKNIFTRRNIIRDLCQQCAEKSIDTIITIGPAPVFTPFIRRITHKNPGLMCFHYGNIYKLQEAFSGQGRFHYKKLRCYKKVFSFFPFKEERLKEYGVSAQFVGHPMLEHFAELIPTGETRPLNSPRCMALLPGRKGATIRQFMPILANALFDIRQQAPGAEVVLPLANATNPRFFEPFAGIEAKYVRGEEKHRAISFCDAAIAVAGESNLTLAVFGVPTVAIYKNPAKSWLSPLRRRREGYKSPINTLLSREAIPEVAAVNHAYIAMQAQQLLDNSPERKAQLSAFKDVRAALRPPEGKSASQMAAKLFLEDLGRLS